MPITTEKINSELWFKIPDSNKLRPFFMSIVSDSNHWLFISSNGGLTAGRKNSDMSLFPYYTDDKITESIEHTGCKTIFQVVIDKEKYRWEPFSNLDSDRYNIERNLYKNRYGNKVMFEEVNHDLELNFNYEWSSSNKFGFIRRCQLVNNSSKPVEISVLDGFQNILPFGVGSDLQSKQSNLVDAYKRSELVIGKIGVFALSAIIVDRAEPSEALKANIVWSSGMSDPTYLLSSRQLDAFRKGRNVSQEEDVKGERGAFMLASDLGKLNQGDKKSWLLVVNVNQSQSDIVELGQKLNDTKSLVEELTEDVELGTRNLIRLVSESDGSQKTADFLKDTRHFANVLFNIMRGGIFDHSYRIEKADFLKHVKNTNKEVFQSQKSFLNELNEKFDLFELEEKLKTVSSSELIRIATEYLPLKFSRRHGDPSRPWNKFSIETRSEVDGSKILNYQGNWRDIFQNWEALAHSYPHFMKGMIYRFLNASTFDGYNPYRLTKDGFDWEVVEPDDPWSFIGYWGDHQIIYLLKFLEFYKDHDPEGFSAILFESHFCYANVPYRIKPYTDILQNPKDTIEFDGGLDKKLRREIEIKGADAAMLHVAGNLYHVSFMEKILATTLAKVSNLVPEGGIWMNTQRPEWNDANNALVGNGLSMVTLYYLYRFTKFWFQSLSEFNSDQTEISAELYQFFRTVKETLSNYKSSLNGELDDVRRKKITDSLGSAASDYRMSIYNQGFSGDKESLKFDELKEFLAVTMEYLEHSISANRRADNLYHSYNLLEIDGDSMSIDYLSEMLEGQVSVLSSGFLSSEESIKVLDALRNSKLYREDQNSYILYPNKDLPRFMQKNNVPAEKVGRSNLLKRMVESKNSVILSVDLNGAYHFNGNFRNSNDLEDALNDLADTEYGELVSDEKKEILELFEATFNHRAFTGRSGTFFGYEGLGSIYWHMVSKLHLAVAEVYISAIESSASNKVLASLRKHFKEIGEGIGIHKDPKIYGAFPTDPYSHTPAHKGAQQPGMTGQVKEDVLVRFLELGLNVKNGELNFGPFLFSKSEFLNNQGEFKFIDTDVNDHLLELEANSIAFTFCGIPMIYQLAEEEGIRVEFVSGEMQEIAGLKMNKEISSLLFNRSKIIAKVIVNIKEASLYQD